MSFHLDQLDHRLRARNELGSLLARAAVLNEILFVQLLRRSLKLAYLSMWKQFACRYVALFRPY